MQCEFSVTVVDNEPPVASGCSNSVQAVANAGARNKAVYWSEPSVTDNVRVTATAANHVPGELFPLGTTRVVYTSMDSSGNKAATCVFDVVVHAKPDIADQLPATLRVPHGGDLLLSLRASGTAPLSFTWRRNGITIPGQVDGIRGSRIVLRNVNASHAGAYTVVVRNPYGVAQSAAATVVVVNPPAPDDNPPPGRAFIILRVLLARPGLHDEARRRLSAAIFPLATLCDLLSARDLLSACELLFACDLLSACELRFACDLLSACDLLFTCDFLSACDLLSACNLLSCCNVFLQLFAACLCCIDPMT